jgi:hypothetical protein
MISERERALEARIAELESQVAELTTENHALHADLAGAREERARWLEDLAAMSRAYERVLGAKTEEEAAAKQRRQRAGAKPMGDKAMSATTRWRRRRQEQAREDAAKKSEGAVPVAQTRGRFVIEFFFGKPKGD